jgi:protoheme IX farnesyltransferase
MYSLVLIPVSMVPTFLGMAGSIYMFGAVVLGLILLCFGLRLACLHLPVNAPRSKQRARQLLQATVIYLPLLFVLMMLNPVSS